MTKYESLVARYVWSAAVACSPTSAALAQSRAGETKTLSAVASNVCSGRGYSAVGGDIAVQSDPDGPAFTGYAIIEVAKANSSQLREVKIVPRDDVREASNAAITVVAYRCNGGQPVASEKVRVTYSDGRASVSLPDGEPYRLSLSGIGVNTRWMSEVLDVTPMAIVFEPFASGGELSFVLESGLSQKVGDRAFVLADLTSLAPNIGADSLIYLRFASPSKAVVETGSLDPSGGTYEFKPFSRVFSASATELERTNGAIVKVGLAKILQISQQVEDKIDVHLKLELLQQVQLVPSPIRISEFKAASALSRDDPLRDELLSGGGLETTRRLQPFKLFVVKLEGGKRYFAKAKSNEFDTYLSVGFIAPSISGVESVRLADKGGQSFYAIGSNDDRVRSDGRVTGDTNSCISFVSAVNGDVVLRVMPAGRPSFGMFTIDIYTVVGNANKCSSEITPE